MIAALSESAEDTRQLARALAGLVRPGDVVLLEGELGAGKTTFVQGFGAGLGVRELITSPTFTLVRTYRGRLELVHADLYRLDHLGEVVDLGLPELLDDGAVAVVEWGDVAGSMLSAEFLEVRMEIGEAEDERRIEVDWVGDSWNDRAAVLADALARWQPGPGRAGSA